MTSEEDKVKEIEKINFNRQEYISEIVGFGSLHFDLVSKVNQLVEAVNHLLSKEK